MPVEEFINSYKPFIFNALSVSEQTSVPSWSKRKGNLPRGFPKKCK
jgi:hypothetical protein